MAAAPSTRGPAAERDSVVYFPGRDLLTVSLQELSDCQFQSEISATLLEVSASNDLRCEATRWHTGATNLEKFIYLMKRLIAELSGVESSGGQDASDIFPSAPLEEGLIPLSGKSLAELRQELPDCEARLFHMRGGASTLAWSYFEKLVCLQNMAHDRSDTGTGSISDPLPVPSGEIKVEALLDTLAWAVNRFGQLSTVIAKIQEAASSMAESSGSLNPKVEAQQQSLVRTADGLLALSANIKVNGENAGPILAVLRQLSKNIENATWQVSGSGKLSNMSMKEQMLSQGKGARREHCAAWEGCRDLAAHLRGCGSPQRQSQRRKSAEQRID